MSVKLVYVCDKCHNNIDEDDKIICSDCFNNLEAHILLATDLISRLEAEIKILRESKGQKEAK